MSGAHEANGFEETELVRALKRGSTTMRQAVCRFALVQKSVLMLKWIDSMDT
jgi:hypothetical protein